MLPWLDAQIIAACAFEPASDFGWKCLYRREDLLANRRPTIRTGIPAEQLISFAHGYLTCRPIIASHTSARGERAGTLDWNAPGGSVLRAGAAAATNDNPDSNETIVHPSGPDARIEWIVAPGRYRKSLQSITASHPTDHPDGSRF